MRTKTKKMKHILWISLLVIICLHNTFAQQSGGYQVGNSVAGFKLKNVDGRMISLSDYNNSKGLIVLFTSNHCPFAKAYEDRIISLQNKYASRGFSVIAINPSDPGTQTDDSFEKMKERAGAKGYTYPYLADETQATAQAFGVSRTPQAFVLSRSNGKFVVSYIGMIDDNPQDPAGATKFYVEEAVTNLLEGKPVVTMSTKPVGCAIKWKN
jgi:peroxiredoxin